MNRYLKLNDWSIVESRWDPENQLKSESIFSIGNGRMGQRANFEEDYSGESLQGTYLAGIYYPDKTKVGWWKNGYPEYFAKVLNAPNWIGIRVESAGETLDLAKVKVSEFHRELNMREGYLQRRFIATFPTGKQLAVDATRFCSLTHDETGAIRYAVTPLNFSGKVTMTPYLDADVQNSDSNYEEKFWEGRGEGNEAEVAWVQAETRKSAFHTVSAMCFKTYLNNQPLQVEASTISRHKYIEQSFTLDVQQNETVVLEKYAANLTSENHAVEDLVSHAIAEVRKVAAIGYDNLKAAQKQAWARRWEDGDIRIEGDSAAQQGIRFNIFQLHQTYTGEDQRLNIGPKGFTGEKYGGSTYWDTEAYCFPFYLNTAGKEVARNLLIYRHKHLQKAIENAEKLGFKNGAALYPMVTIKGEECHNEWEITFEEIHRNGAIAFAIYNYVRHSDDSAYLAEFGFDVLLGISRFWAQRITWSEQRQAYVMLGVTGPN
ncbi:MAG: glycoside hydrolase family 65 protein, partial [Salibacteraceae bacterium]